MTSQNLEIFERPQLANSRMLLGFSGWMDGGDVSTGTIEFFMDNFDTRPLAEIHPDDFYIYNFPGPMEISSFFRPHVQLVAGVIHEYTEPVNRFHYNAEHRLILFSGKEPHLKWQQYVRCIFEVARNFGVKEMYFTGSVSGMVPHSREPRVSAGVSGPSLQGRLNQCNVRLTDYQGPAGITTYLTRVAYEQKIDMISLIAETPPYIQGRNPRCIESVLKRLAKLLDMELDLEGLRLIGDELEKKLDGLIRNRGELAEHIKTLEENYDKDVFDTNMGDLKQWLTEQGIRLD